MPVVCGCTVLIVADTAAFRFLDLPKDIRFTIYDLQVFPIRTTHHSVVSKTKTGQANRLLKLANGPGMYRDLLEKPSSSIKVVQRTIPY